MTMFKSSSLSLEQLRGTTAWSGGGRHLCFLFPDDGRASCTSNGTCQALEPGDVLVLSNQIAGSINLESHSKFTAAYFLVFFESLASLFRVGEIHRLDHFIASLSRPKCFPRKSKVAGECCPLLALTPPAGLEQRAHLLRIATRILSEESGHGPSGPASPTTCEMTDLVSRMSLDDIQALNVEELAVKMGFTPRHLQRLFKKSFGSSAAALKMEARLLKTLWLLKNPGMKIIDVALECGFNHFGMFSQAFRRRFGVSAKEWRNQDRIPKDLCSLVNDQCKMRAQGMCLWSNSVKHNGDHRGNGHGDHGGNGRPRRKRTLMTVA